MYVTTVIDIFKDNLSNKILDKIGKIIFVSIY